MIPRTLVDSVLHHFFGKARKKAFGSASGISSFMFPFLRAVATKHIRNISIHRPIHSINVLNMPPTTRTRRGSTKKSTSVRSASAKRIHDVKQEGDQDIHAIDTGSAKTTVEAEETVAKSKGTKTTVKAEKTMAKSKGTKTTVKVEKTSDHQENTEPSAPNKSIKGTVAPKKPKSTKFNNRDP